MGILDSIGKVASAISPVAGIASSVIGGITGTAAQKSANKTNLQIAQETNQTNREIARESNDLTYKMMQEQMKYASPEEQRRMYEEAGVNPYLGVAHSASPTSSPTAITGASQIAPSVMPEDAFARSIGDASSTLVQNLVGIAQAKKANAEAAGQEIENDVKADILERQFSLLGLDEEFNQIRNSFERSKQQLNIDVIEQQKLLND